MFNVMDVLLATDSSRYNPAVAAGFYSQLCGVLAGFAFTGLVLVATTRPGGSSSQSAMPHGPSVGTTLSLLGAMIGLAVCSLSYAVAAADPLPASGLVAHVFAAVAFATAAYALIVALHLLFVDCQLPGVVTRVSRMTSIAVIALANIHLLGGLGEISVVADSSPVAWIGYIGCSVTALGVLVWGAVMYRRNGTVLGMQPKPFQILMVVIIAVTIISSAVGALIAGNGLTSLTVAGGFLAFGLMTVLSWLGAALSVRLKLERP